MPIEHRRTISLLAVTLGVATLSLTTGCSGGRPIDGGDGGQVGGPATRAPKDPTSDPSCQGSPASYQDYATRAELETLLIRRWKRCITPQLAGETVGVEFTADGFFYPLAANNQGFVVRRTGIDFVGKWTFYPVGDIDPFFGNVLTRPVMVLNDVLTDAPKFTNDPRQLRITFTPVLGRYVPLDP